ncbi:cold-shock protein [Nocardia bovistercoris]|uniref:Cold-shock protein n=1 Tax=Nocardia bovistercoris TaxID=2785916 RepID=A0A931IAW6_9NOCA|nr:cold-shock protein [Nocardia bovistercoris]MBH0777241.1 cold-shock protein [Nocardia bovistercoris]
MERATVYRWNIGNGTGVLTRPDGTLAWFHLSTVDLGDVRALREGDDVDVEIENVPQGEYECRATSVRRHTG